MKGCCSNQEETFSAIFNEIKENYSQFAVLSSILIFVISVIVLRHFLSMNDDKNVKSGTQIVQKGKLIEFD